MNGRDRVCRPSAIMGTEWARYTEWVRETEQLEGRHKLLRGSRPTEQSKERVASQEDRDKANAAEVRTQQTRGFMQQVRGEGLGVLPSLAHSLMALTQGVPFYDSHRVSSVYGPCRHASSGNS